MDQALCSAEPGQDRHRDINLSYKGTKYASNQYPHFLNRMTKGLQTARNQKKGQLGLKVELPTKEKKETLNIFKSG